MRIDQGHFERGMAHQLAHGIERDSCHHQSASEGVAAVVKPEIVDLGRFEQGSECFSEFVLSKDRHGGEGGDFSLVGLQYGAGRSV